MKQFRGLFVLLVLTYSQASMVDLQQCINKASSEVDIRECIGVELEYQDFLLNKYYKVLKRQAESKEGEKVLRDAQRAWIKYRDANCEFEAFPMKNGSGWTTLHLECLNTMTTQRAQALKTNINTVYRE
jgi:uncharacterized protein YecT (DUF1311 family)